VNSSAAQGAIAPDTSKHTFMDYVKLNSAKGKDKRNAAADSCRVRFLHVINLGSEGDKV